MRKFVRNVLLWLALLGLIWPMTLTDLAAGQSLAASTDCGDVDGDGWFNGLDIEWLNDYMFHDGPAPIGIADMDECGSVNLGDTWYLIEYLFLGGSLPCEGSVTCQQPTGGNSVDLECRIFIYEPNGDSVAIPVYMTNDISIRGVSLGFTHNSPDVEITSVSFAGSITGDEFIRGFNVDPTNNEVSIYWAHAFTSISPQAGGLFATMWVQVPENTPGQVVDIDSTFIGPATEFIFVPEDGGVITPAYNDCGTAEIVIVNSQADVCGDSNCDGGVNVGDAVYIINYVFKGGDAPCASCP